MKGQTHTLKSWPEFFRAIVSGIRTHELRRNDRLFHVGDYLELREFHPETQTYTGAWCLVEIASMTSIDFPCAASREGLNPDFCILSIKVKDYLVDARLDDLPFDTVH